jgi:methylated-DNA-protein-cysteine methyltransferase related protein
MKKQSFWADVYDVTKLIPAGRVTTYGAIAEFLQLGAPRMVGWALNAALEVDIPAHRVVNRKGELSGRLHFATPTRMQELLEMEGIVVKDAVIVDFKRHFWHPLQEIG